MAYNHTIQDETLVSYNLHKHNMTWEGRHKKSSKPDSQPAICDDSCKMWRVDQLLCDGFYHHKREQFVTTFGNRHKRSDNLWRLLMKSSRGTLCDGRYMTTGVTRDFRHKLLYMIIFWLNVTNGVCHTSPVFCTFLWCYMGWMSSLSWILI